VKYISLKKSFSFLIILFLFSFSFANPKNLESVLVKFEKSGRIFSSSEIVKGNLTFFIPKNSIILHSNLPYSIYFDNFGNKKVSLDISKIKGNFVYNFTFLVKNDFQRPYYENYSYKVQYFKNFTNFINFDDSIKNFAIGNQSFFDKVLFFLNWINKNVIYEKEPLRKSSIPSVDVWKFRKGVCTEFSNIMASFLKLNGFPVKYVVGYALPSLNESFWGHAWLEVFYNNQWIPLDPTWNMFYYLDASHIKFAELLDSNDFKDELYYSSFSNVEWYPNEDKVELLNFSVKEPIKFSLKFNENLKVNESSLIELISNSSYCLVNEIEYKDCFGRSDKRFYFLCNSSKVYFFFDNNLNKKNFACQFSISDSYGNYLLERIFVSDEILKSYLPNISISFDGKKLIVNTSKQSLILLKELNVYNFSNFLSLEIERSGNYTISVFSDGKLFENSFNLELGNSFSKNFYFSLEEKLNLFQKIINFIINVLSKMRKI